MAETEKSTATNRPPKGGRKGGTLFPKINLTQALDYGKKLVAKTHTGALPEKTILPGVFKNAGAAGKVRGSALKQFGLMQGNAHAYEATKLAKDIDAAPLEERLPLLQRAFLSSKLFKEIFTTFQDDSVSKAKIEQRAKGLEVHPESAAECAQLFMESAVTAGLGTINGELIALVNAGASAQGEESAEGQDHEKSDDHEGVEDGAAAVEEATTAAGAKNSRHDESGKRILSGAKAGVTVNLNVDSSSDPDKLEKQLRLLREFGVI